MTDLAAKDGKKVSIRLSSSFSFCPAMISLTTTQRGGGNDEVSSPTREEQSIFKIHVAGRANTWISELCWQVDDDAMTESTDVTSVQCFASIL